MRLRCFVVAVGLGLTWASAAFAEDEFPVQFGGPFSLIDHEGVPRGDEDFRGRFLLVYFGYTACPDLCPLGLATLSTAMDLLDAAGERVQPLFITVDPARDTSPVLNDYIAHFHPGLVGLTGSEAQVRAAAKAYKVHRRKVVPAGEAAADYLVDHSTLTYLMAPDGRFVTLFPHGTRPEPMAAAIRNYLTE